MKYILVWKSGMEPMEVVGFELFGSLEEVEMEIEGRVELDDTFEVMYIGSTKAIGFSKNVKFSINKE